MAGYKLFDGYGIEIEYMIVDKHTLKVAPVADKLLEKLCGKPANECTIDQMGYSNELVKHVIEIKTDGPAQYEGLGDMFHSAVLRVQRILEPMGCMLMPSAMHPTMNPLTETKLWKDENAEIYEAYDRIFNCKGHGWSNLQSVHINLPFSGDDEFRRLHAAVRAVLPIIPALCASSPVVEGKLTGIADNRLEYYRNNQVSVPEAAGKIIPERVFSEAEYNEKIFEVLAEAIKPHDPKGILEPIWLNSRGAIARFDRGAVEIRLIDVQECPQADIAVAKLVSETVRYLANPKKTEKLMALDEDSMQKILLKCIREGENAIVSNDSYLSALGMDGSRKAGMIWEDLFDLTGMNKDFEYADTLAYIFAKGTLSTRIKKGMQKGTVTNVIKSLCSCLRENRLYNA